MLKKNLMVRIDAVDKISMPEIKWEYFTISEVKQLIATPCYRERGRFIFSAVSAVSGMGIWRR